MKRRTDLYKMVIESIRANDKSFFDEFDKEILLKKFLEDYYSENIIGSVVAKKSVQEKSGDEKEVALDSIEDENIIDVKNKHLCYYLKNVVATEESIDCNKEKMRDVVIEYIKYDKTLKVVDKNTLEEKFVKRKEYGDLEKQHYIIETYNTSNKALIVWERIAGAVTISLLEKELSKKYREWLKKRFANEVLKEYLGYNIKIYAIPSKDFFEELEDLDKISVLKVSVEKEELTLDEDIVFSEDNISREEVELVYKPINGLSFSKRKIKQYVEKIKENKNDKKKINKVVISGMKDRNLITLNTDLIKMNETIEIKEGVDGLIDTADLFEKFRALIKGKNSYLEDIFIDVEEEEE